MPITVNELMGARARNWSTVVGEAQIDSIVIGPCRIFGACVSSTSLGSVTLEIHDALNADGTADLVLPAGAAWVNGLNLTETGIRFSTGLSIKTAVAVASGTVWYLAE